MKFFLIVSLVSFSLSAMAEGDAKFAGQKSRMIEEISKQMEVLQTTKSCVEGSTDLQGIKKCHETAKAERQKMKSEKMKMKSEMIDSKIKKLEEEKKKMEEKK